MAKKVNKPVKLSSIKVGGNKASGKDSGAPAQSKRPSTYRPSKVTYKDILASTTFLKVKQRSLKINGIDITSIDFSSFEIRFICNSATIKGKKYTVILQLNPIDPKVIIDKKTNIRNVFQQAGMKIWCSCPAHLYWGFQYRACRYDYAAFPGYKVPYPYVRNPKLLGVSCKHVRAVAMAFPFLINDIAKQFKNFYTQEQLKAIGDSLEHALKGIKLSV